jgi:hypothetical protein
MNGRDVPVTKNTIDETLLLQFSPYLAALEFWLEVDITTLNAAHYRFNVGI